MRGPARCKINNMLKSSNDYRTLLQYNSLYIYLTLGVGG